MALAGLRRSGNAGAHTPTNHIAVLDDVLERLPRETAADAEIGVRADSAGATHELLVTAVRYGLLSRWAMTGPQSDPRCESRGLSAGLDAQGVARSPRSRACLASPRGHRLVGTVRGERPYRGAQPSFTHHDGHRFQAILTAQTSWDIAALSPRHRARAVSRIPSAPPRTPACKVGSASGVAAGQRGAVARVGPGCETSAWPVTGRLALAVGVIVVVEAGWCSAGGQRG